MTLLNRCYFFMAHRSNGHNSKKWLWLHCLKVWWLQTPQNRLFWSSVTVTSLTSSIRPVCLTRTIRCTVCIKAHIRSTMRPSPRAQLHTAVRSLTTIPQPTTIPELTYPTNTTTQSAIQEQRTQVKSAFLHLQIKNALLNSVLSQG